MRDGGDLSRLRQLNERTVLTVVRDAGLREPTALRVVEIVSRSGLGRTAVEEVLQNLAARQWLVEEAAPITGRGRPARRYRFRAEAGIVAGLDIGAYGIRGVLTDLGGRVVTTGRVAVSPSTKRRSRLAAAERLVSDCVSRVGRSPDDVWALGVGTTGQVDRAGRVTHCRAIPDWEGLDLFSFFVRRYRDNIVVDNDSQLAAVAERRWGIAAGVDDLVLLQAGRRTGLAMMLDGQLRRGFHGAAGDLSLMPQVKWEAAIEHLHRCVPSSVPLADRAEAAFALARSGRATAVRAVQRYAAAMAMAAATAVAIVDPELLILGGAFSKASDVLLEPLGSELGELCHSVPLIRASVLGAECAALGGCSLALDVLYERLSAPARGPLPDLSVNSL